MTNLCTDSFDDDLNELSTAEDFLDYFGIQFDPAVVQVNRLHILQRFHDYLANIPELSTAAPSIRRTIYATQLQQAYQDFVHSNATTEKVFRVFRMNEPRSATVPLSHLIKQVPYASSI